MSTEQERNDILRLLAANVQSIIILGPPWCQQD